MYHRSVDASLIQQVFEYVGRYHWKNRGKQTTRPEQRWSGQTTLDSKFHEAIKKISLEQHCSAKTDPGGGHNP